MMKVRYTGMIAVVLVILSFIGGSAVLADAPVEGRPGRAELRFLEGMIDHHQMALDMANDCLLNAQTEAVLTLCQAVITAQSREIETMRGWLLAWYGVDYAPMSMFAAVPTVAAAVDATAPGMGMGMMGGAQGGMGMMGGAEGGMGMMGNMQGMMANMAEMMGMMANMMGMMGGAQGGMGMMGGAQGGMGMMGGAEGGMGMMGGAQGGMGMMGGAEGGMGMMGGAQGGMGTMGGAEGGMGAMGGAQGGMGMMGGMPVEHGLRVLTILTTLTVGDVLTSSTDLDPTTPLLDIIDDLFAAGEFELDPTVVLPMMGAMTYDQWLAMLTEMHQLTLADVETMRGHLDNGDAVTMLGLMQHHMEAMAGGTATVGSTAGGDATDHAAHHPEQGGPAASAAASTGTTDHSQHQTSAATSDPAMTMGMFAGLSALTGIDYEIAWLEAMIDHHDDALHMAERLLAAVPAEVGHADLLALADQIITDQTAEIAAMEALIVELSTDGS